MQLATKPSKSAHKCLGLATSGSGNTSAPNNTILGHMQAIVAIVLEPQSTSAVASRGGDGGCGGPWIIASRPEAGWELKPCKLKQ